MLAAPLAMALSSCGGVHREAASADAKASDGKPQVVDEWKTETWEERHDVMTFAVLPNMGRLFQRFRGEPYPTMTCATCHGKDGESVDFKMPRGLPPLDPKHMPDPDSTDPKEARITKFMIEEVTPQMADLMGKPRMDPKTHRGFSCFGCHARLSSSSSSSAFSSTTAEQAKEATKGALR